MPHASAGGGGAVLPGSIGRLSAALGRPVAGVQDLIGVLRSDARVPLAGPCPDQQYYV